VVHGNPMNLLTHQQIVLKLMYYYIRSDRYLICYRRWLT
jgi:hypothetical protein